MYILKPADYAHVRPLFAGLPQRVAIEATLAGYTDGTIYVDDPIRPAAAFIWNAFRFGFLAGDPANESFVAALADLLAFELLPAARDSHDPTLVIYPTSPDWRMQLPALLGGREILSLRRRTFNFDAARVPVSRRINLPTGLRLEPVDAARIAASPELQAEISLLWHSVQAFLSHGLGYCVMAGDQVASVCLSAFAGGKLREISVSTHPDYRRQGLAQAVCRAFIYACRWQGLTPVWECWHDNLPSVKLAETLGFRQVEDYPVYFLDLTHQSELLNQGETNVGQR